MPSWLLPENIADILPAQARKIEQLRRAILDRFQAHGYELVIPPLLEYLESLMAGTGQDMNLHTFKLVDQLSGRSMGVRADMTTQVARIDAHLLNRSGVTRLCYVGSVLHTRPLGLHATREPLQIGAEIYGYAGLEADAEIQQLALTCLHDAGLLDLRIDLCHVGVVRAIIDSDPAARADQIELQRLLQAKDLHGLRSCSQSYSAITRDALIALPALYGDVEVLTRARTLLPPLPGVTSALNQLDALVKLSANGSQLTIDLADLRGFQYESAATFAVYVPGLANAIARGGRYDHVGELFGRARPATGFSMDLRELVRLLPLAPAESAIRAPWGQQPALLEKIASLRAAKQIVIQDFPNQQPMLDECQCKRELVEQNGKWSLKNLE